MMAEAREAAGDKLQAGPAAAERAHEQPNAADPPRHTTKVAEGERKLLGAFSVFSGACMLLFPDKMARVYGFPQREWLARSLGMRDIVVGLELCTETGAQRASLLRALSDTLDAGLIAGEALRQGKLGREAGLKVSSAALLATYARLLHERLRAAAG